LHEAADGALADPLAVLDPFVHALRKLIPTRMREGPFSSDAWEKLV
jgi:hypothetical protein